MHSRREFLRRWGRSATMLALSATGLSACGTPLPASRCEFVSQKHLVRQRDGSGRTLICNPQQVNARYRARYFPDYEWGQ